MVTLLPTTSSAARSAKSAGRYAMEVFDGMAAKVAGKTGGAFGMNLFSTKNHGAQTYVRNENMWLHDLRQQLSCAVVRKGPYDFEDLGGVLITPRHVMYCAHYWPDYGTGTGDIRFVTGDNTVVNCLQIGSIPVAGADLSVSVLDRDVEVLGVHVVPIWGGPNRSQLIAKTEVVPLFAISQGYNAGQEPWGPPISDYPNEHDVMCYIRNDRSFTSNGYFYLPPPMDEFDYNVYTMDSGTPKFILYQDVIYLFGIIVSGGWGSVPPFDHIAAINDAIIAADDEAIANGHLASRTNLTVSITVPPEP